MTNRASVTEKLHLAGLLPAVQAICANAGVTVTEVVERDERGHLSRFRPVSECRGRVFQMVRQSRSWSYPYIAKLFDVDHTSVMAAVRKLGPSSRETVATLSPNGEIAGGNAGPGWSEPGASLGTTSAEPVVASRALALAPTQSQGLDSSQLSNLTPESHECSALSQTRESTASLNESKETIKIAAAIMANPEFSDLLAFPIARKIEGWRMSKGTPVEWVTAAIHDCAAKVTGLGLTRMELQSRLVGFAKAAKAPRQAESGVQRSARSWRQPEAEAGKGIDYPELRQPGPEEQPAPMTPERIAQLEQLAGTPSQRMVPRREPPPPVEHQRIESETNPEILAKAKADRLELLRRFGEGAGK